MLESRPAVEGGIAIFARRKLHKRAFSEIDRGTLGSLLFNARKQKRFTQAELANGIGRDRPWLSDVETGKITHVPDDDLRSLAAVLDAALEDLVRARDRTAVRPYQLTSPVPGAHERHCASCGRSNPWDANFCSSCGVRLPAEIACSECSRRNPGDASFCAYCGRPLHTAVPV